MTIITMTIAETTYCSNEVLTEPAPVNTKPILEISPSVEKTNPSTIVEVDLTEIEPYILPSRFEYYQGTVPKQEITKVSFTHTAPEQYDEIWNVNDYNELKGYLTGTEVYIVGEKFYTNRYAGPMFAGRDRWDEPLFSNLATIEGLDLLNTSITVNMSDMFHGNTNLTELNLESWDVSNVNDMTLMFAGCLNLETLHVSTWKTHNVQYFTAMFQGDDHVGNMKLKNIDVSNWDISSAWDVSHMFYGCGSLEYLDVSKWDVSNVRAFSHTFADCFKLKDLDMRQWNTANVVTFDAIFNDCHSFTVLDVSGLDTANCQQFSQMFEACKNLKEIIGIENMDVSNAQDYAFSEMFHACHSLEKLDLTKWDTSKADDFGRMFSRCDSLTELDLSNFAIDNLQSVYEMFKDSRKLKEVKGVDEWTLDKVSGVSSMFQGTNLKR